MSFSVTVLAPSVTEVEPGVVVSVGLAALTATCSLALLLSLTVLLLVSPLYVASHW